MRNEAMPVGAVLTLLLALAGCGQGDEGRKPVAIALASVQATVETDPVGTADADAADDPAIWRNAADPAASLIVGTDKKAGLYVYGLDGKVRDFVRAGRLNNVDLAEVAGPGNRPLIFVGASDRSNDAVPQIALFALDGATGQLRPLGAMPFLPPARTQAEEAYGFCMGPARATGEIARAYVVFKDGEVAESALVDRGGGIRAAYVRSMKLASQSEGCVVDGETDSLYVGEEDVGIWRFDLKAPVPKAERFASVGPAAGLVADVEGLGIARDGEKAWLIASSQGDNSYALLDLASGRLAGRFRITDGTLGGTSETDGIAVSVGDFGLAFPDGLFVAQDGENKPKAQNFKLVPWGAIREALPAH